MKCRYRVDDRNVDEQCVCDREGETYIHNG